MAQLTFAPFYQRFSDRLGLGLSGKIVLSLIAGAAFFLPYFIRTGAAALHDWSWLLAALISSALAFLYYATDTLQRILPRWEEHAGEGGPADYLEPLTRTLSDRRFLLAGVLTGGLNMLLGLCFGVPAGDPVANGLLFFGFFLAGFFCGLPAYGIYGVLVTVNAFTAAAKPALDYTAPDRCGGMAFIGEALVVFSVVTLLEGCLIAAYILNATWTSANDGWILLLKWLWVIVPFLFSLLVLLSPAVKLKQMLLRYREAQERDLQRRCADLRLKIDENRTETAGLETLHKEYDYLVQRRDEVHRMRTWPFGSVAVTSYIGSFVANLLLAKDLVEKLMA